MPARGGSRILLALGIVLALRGSVLATETATGRLDELKALLKAGKYGEVESGARTLLSEVEAASGADSVEAAAVLDVLVESLWRAGKTRGPEARTLAERAIAIKERTLGPDQPELAYSLNNLGILLQNSRDYAAARPLYERALTIREKALGPDDPKVAVSVNNLANLFMEQGDYAAARPLYERALAIREKTLGPEHLDVALSLSNLASLLVFTSDYAAARPLYERALAIQEKALGQEHADVAMTLSKLANLYADSGDYAAARPLYERSLLIREKVFGPDHPRVAASLNNLANLFQETGDYAAARPLYERALAIKERAFGPDHPDVAASLDNLAVLLMKTSDYAAARPLYERALAMREKGLGPDHPDVATSLNNLAIFFEMTGDYAAARPLHERALAIREKALGADHPDVAASLNNLAIVLARTGDYSAARSLHERALAIKEKRLGPFHPDVAASLNNLANVLSDTGDYAAARPLYERALAILEKAFGPDHPDVAGQTIDLAHLFIQTGDYAAARALYERAVAIWEKALGPGHPDVATSLAELASVLERTGDSTAARALYERALAIQEKALGPDHYAVARTLAGLAGVLRDTGDYAAARPLYERALSIQVRALGAGNPEVAANLESLARLQAAQGETAGSLEHALEAERIAREHLRVTSSSLSERQALRYASMRMSGLDLALTLAARGLDPASRRRVLDSLVLSRAVVLDEMATRHRAVRGAVDPEVTRLAEALTSARTHLANLAIRGPGGQKPEIYLQMLDEARRETEKAEGALGAASASFARENSRSRIGLDQVASNLPPRSALVAFTRYSSIGLEPKAPAAADSKAASKGSNPAGEVPRYLAFVLRAGERDPQAIDLGKADEIESLVARWKREASGAAMRAGTSQDEAATAYREVGTVLRKRVWDPLAPSLTDIGRVFIVPDGALNLVSIAALPLDDGGYLIERGPTVHYASAERDLVPLGETRYGEGLLALGAPSYDATSPFAALRKEPPGAAQSLVASAASYRGLHSACGGFATVHFDPLPATGAETREVVRMWKRRGENASTTVLDLREAAAGETQLKRSAPGRRVLHLATHGFFLDGGDCESALAPTRGIGGLAETPIVKAEDVPPPVTGENPLLLSGLALAGANHRSAAGEGEDDGILTAEEIASLDLSGVEWAVLSACETGVGNIRAGEGVFGLRRAFQVAGAGTLIMSLWSVDDEATRSWMTALYKARLERHLDTAEAVRQASQSVLAQRRKAGLSVHPFYWAAFVAAGDWK